MGKTFEHTYDINYCDVNCFLEANTSCLLNLICDIGMRQSQSLGESVERLMNKGYGWVFYKYDFKFYKYPRVCEKFKVRTYCYGLKKFYAFRKYFLENENGELIGEGIATFLMINLKRRRLMRIPEDEYKLYGVKEDLEDILEIEDIPKFEDGDLKKDFNVGYREIDTNFHVNNVNYLDWSMETLPKEVILKKYVSRVVINFLKECSYGDNISCIGYITEDGKESIHKIVNNEGKELALVHLYLEDR